MVKAVRIERPWEVFTFEAPWGHVSGKWYGDQSQQPILAMHGWQDNAGTFDPIMAYLPTSIPVLSIDFPGHGESCHLPPGMQYQIYWNNVLLIRRMIKHFGWKQIRMIGHSLGGAVAFLYSSCFPDDVLQIILIDAYGPAVKICDNIVNIAGARVDRALRYEKLLPSEFPCTPYDEMISLVVHSYKGSLDRDSAEILMKRGLKKVSNRGKDGYSFSNDFRLQFPYWGFFSYQEVLLHADRIKCHVLNIKGDPGSIREIADAYTKVIEMTRKNAKVEYHEVPGTHHVHMGAPEAVVKIISKFLLNPENQLRL